jgi:dienelactone hydrolase
MPWSAEFINGETLLLHHGATWSLRSWPSLSLLEEGNGALMVERMSGRRAVPRDAGSWTVDGFGELCSSDPISQICWLNQQTLAIMTGEPGRRIPATRLPVPEAGVTAHVFGTVAPGNQELHRLSLTSGRCITVARAGPNEMITHMAAGADGGIDYVRVYSPVPGFEPGRHRFRIIRQDGSDSDPLPHLPGPTEPGPRSPSGLELVAHSGIAPFFPRWWELCRYDGRPVVQTQRRLLFTLARFNPAETHVAIPVEDGLNVSVAVVPLDSNSGQHDRLLPLPGMALSLTHSPGGRIIALVRTIDGSIWLVDAAQPSDPLLQLWRPVASHIDVRAWKYRSGGDELQGILIRPQGAHGSLPMVVDLHGGPSPGLAAGMTYMSRWCRYGYAVFAPEFRTSGCLGPQAMLAGEKDEPDAGGLTDVDDVMAGIDSLTAAGLADPRQLFLYGHSYGGTLVNRLARGPIAQAAVSHEAVTDRSLAYLVEGGNPIDRDLLGGHPWEHPERYERQSDLKSADEIKIPLLLVYGDEHPAQGIALYTALRGRGHPVELFIYAGEGHTMQRPENEQDLERRAVEWFRAHAPVDPAPQ